MAAKAEFDSWLLSDAMEELSKLSGRDFSTVVKAEAAKVLEKASSYTKRANQQNIRKAVEKSWLKDEKKQARLLWKLKAIGLAKKSFLEVAEKMNVANNVKVPAYVANAEHYKAASSDTSAREEGSGSSYVLIGEISGNRTYPGAQMYSAINKAMRGRVNFFKTNLRKGALDKLETLLAKYPFLRVQR